MQQPPNAPMGQPGQSAALAGQPDQAGGVSTPYAFETRYSLCTRCGAVIPVPLEGGVVTCGGCNETQTVPPRDNRPIHQIEPHPVTPEVQRIQALRAQDGRPFLPPAGLQSLVIGGSIQSDKVNEGFAAWQSSRRELATTGSFEAAERLLFLTLFLPQWGPEMGPLQTRAFHEAAADIMNVARHRQLVLGQLARLAAKHGDTTAAAAWLALCDPQPNDLDMDSTYRASRALIATIQQRWQDVIQVLGSGPDDIPIADFLDRYCGVLRANAWEKMGRVDVAVQLLDAELRRGASTVAGILKGFPICEQSYPQAYAQHEQASADMTARGAGGTLGAVLLFTGAFQGIIGLALLAGAGLNFVGVLDVAAFGASNDLESSGGAALAGLIMLVVGAGLSFRGIKARRKAARARYIRLHGKQGTAQLTACERTGTKVNNVPQWEIQMNVMLPGQAPYAASQKLVLSQVAVANMQGKTVVVRVHPDDPSEVVIQLN